jgi:hypothetical protein
MKKREQIEAKVWKKYPYNKKDCRLEKQRKEWLRAEYRKELNNALAESKIQE